VAGETSGGRDRVPGVTSADNDDRSDEDSVSEENVLTEARRAAMVNLAIGLIAEGGIGGLTFRSIAKEAGTSTAPFTTEFGTREVMLNQVLMEVWRRLGVQEGELETDDPLETLRLVLRRATPVDRPVSPEMEAWLNLYVEAVHNEPLKRALVEVEAEQYPTYTELIGKAQAAGQIPTSHDPDDLLAGLWALGDGLLLGYMLYPENFTSERTGRIWEQGFRALIDSSS
jgi:AcrR family transcriptional regulator